MRDKTLAADAARAIVRVNETDEIQTGIPVYLSSFTPVERMPERYGAFICWEIGQRVEVRFRNGPVGAVVRSATRWHQDARVIDGARGPGRWVREVQADDRAEPDAVSEDQIFFAPGTKVDAR